MSRRRRTDADRSYAALRLICPAGHRLAPRVLRIDPPERVATAPGYQPRYRYVLNPGIERVDAPDGRTKLRVSCEKCHAAGRRSDLQVSWDRAREALDEVHADPTRGTVDFQIIEGH